MPQALQNAASRETSAPQLGHFVTPFICLMFSLHSNISAFSTILASSVAAVSSSGLLTVTNQYQGISGKTTKGEITTYIEKKTWGLFWKRVDIGEPNNEWYDVIYNYVYAGDHTFQLPSKGTYRITVVYVISGSGGAPDTITRTIKKTY